MPGVDALCFSYVRSTSSNIVKPVRVPKPRYKAHFPGPVGFLQQGICDAQGSKRVTARLHKKEENKFPIPSLSFEVKMSSMWKNILLL